MSHAYTMLWQDEKGNWYVAAMTAAGTEPEDIAVAWRDTDYEGPLKRDEMLIRLVELTSPEELFQPLDETAPEDALMEWLGTHCSSCGEEISEASSDGARCLANPRAGPCGASLPAIMSHNYLEEAERALDCGVLPEELAAAARRLLVREPAHE